MKINDIMHTIQSLAHSQGFYGRLYRELQNIQETAPELWKEVVDELEGQKFRDTVDMVLYFEC